MSKFLYNKIICFWNHGWQADYKDIYSGPFALHRASTKTKAECMRIAKAEIDNLNNRMAKKMWEN